MIVINSVVKTVGLILLGIVIGAISVFLIIGTWAARIWPKD